MGGVAGGASSFEELILKTRNRAAKKALVSQHPAPPNLGTAQAAAVSARGPDNVQPGARARAGSSAPPQDTPVDLPRMPSSTGNDSRQSALQKSDAGAAEEQQDDLTEEGARTFNGQPLDSNAQQVDSLAAHARGALHCQSACEGEQLLICTACPRAGEIVDAPLGGDHVLEKLRGIAVQRLPDAARAERLQVASGKQAFDEEVPDSDLEG